MESQGRRRSGWWSCCLGAAGMLFLIMALVFCVALVGLFTGANRVTVADEPSVASTPTPFQPVANTPTPVVVQPTAQPTAQAVPVQPVSGQGWPSNLFRTPVKCQESFNPESAWLICEPGVILNDTAAWTIPGTNAAWFINVPEGGFTYFSMGHGTITIDGVSLNLPGEEGLNYLVVIRGRIDDGIVDSDLNDTAKITGFTPGHAIWSIMPPGAYVSKDWFRDQLVVSTTATGTNCGATGCSRTRIVLFDVDSHFEQRFEVHSGNLDNWSGQ